jgi:hypothetical protein
MQITDAQRENRVRFRGGFYGQLVSGVLWLVSAALATWSTPKAAIVFIVLGGFFIFPVTELLVRVGGGQPFSRDNSLPQLGMQVAFVMPFSMFLLVPVTEFRLTLFYPATMILLGAHYMPFVFLYGMRMFAVLGALLLAAGLMIGMYLPGNFNIGAWYTGIVLVIFAMIGKALVAREMKDPSR